MHILGLNIILMITVIFAVSTTTNSANLGIY